MFVKIECATSQALEKTRSKGESKEEGQPCEKGGGSQTWRHDPALAYACNRPSMHHSIHEALWSTSI